MSESSKSDDFSKSKKVDKLPAKQPEPQDQYDDTWDEWYDDIDFYNKKSKIKRSKKRFYKNGNEW